VPLIWQHKNKTNFSLQQSRTNPKHENKANTSLQTLEHHGLNYTSGRKLLIHQLRHPNEGRPSENRTQFCAGIFQSSMKIEWGHAPSGMKINEAKRTARQ
jgi:hypothetical protein